MYDEIKVTRYNIRKLSQFKKGDKVTLLKKIETDEGIYNAGRVMKIEKVTVHPFQRTPNKTFEKFKKKYKVNESIFTLYLNDFDTKEFLHCDIKCNASDVIQGRITGDELKTAIKNYKKQYAMRYITAAIFMLISLSLFLLIMVSDIVSDLLSVYSLIAIVSVLSFILSFAIPFNEKPWRRIKTKERNSNEKKE